MKTYIAIVLAWALILGAVTLPQVREASAIQGMDDLLEVIPTVQIPMPLTVGYVVGCVVAAAQINSGPVLNTATCGDNDTHTVFVDTILPTTYDGETFTLKIAAVAVSATPSGDLAGDVAMQCRGDSEAVNNTWGGEITLDVTFDTQYDLEFATSAAVTPDITCVAGDHLYVRWQQDATGSDGTITAHILGFSLVY